MNRENLLRVADAIEKHEIADLGFNMCDFIGDGYIDRSGHECGTTACIGGFAAALLRNHKDASDLQMYWDDPETRSLRDDGAAFLGLNGFEASDLFGGTPRALNFDDVTPAMAVATLRYAEEHDVIDWDAANPEIAA